MAYRIDQIELLAAIWKELERQGINGAIPRIANVTIAAANDIIAECARDPVMASDSMGLDAWLRSDDTGLSSRYMASRLSSRNNKEYGWPHDPDDLGRCIRLLVACPELKNRLSEMESWGQHWKALYSKWDELTSLFNEEFPSGRAPRTYKLMEQIYENMV